MVSCTTARQVSFGDKIIVFGSSSIDARKEWEEDDGMMMTDLAPFSREQKYPQCLSSRRSLSARVPLRSF